MNYTFKKMKSVFIENSFLLFINGIARNYPAGDAATIPMTHNAPTSRQRAFKELLLQFWNSVEIVWRAPDECVGVKWRALHDTPSPWAAKWLILHHHMPACVPLCLRLAAPQLSTNRRALTGCLSYCCNIRGGAIARKIMGGGGSF